jgi:hypothetical protein
MTKKKKWLLGIGGGILLLLAWIVLLSPWVWPGGGIDSLIISKETTWLTNPPMKPNGTVNYVQYIVDRESQGVTPENNAFACLVRALGPKYLDALMDVGALDSEQIKPWLGFNADQQEGPFLGDVEEVLLQYATASPDDDDEWIDTCDIENRLKISPWTTAEYPNVKAWFAANATPLEWIVKGSQKERYSSWPPLDYDDPSNQHLMSAELFGFSGARNMGRLFAMRSMNKLGEGDIEGAWADAMVIRRLSRLISQESSLISQLIGYALDAQGNATQEVLLRSKRLTTSQAMGMLKELQSLLPIPSLEEAMELELLTSLDTVMVLIATDSADTLLAQHMIDLGDETVESKLIQKLHPNLGTEQMLRSVITSWIPMVRRASLSTMSQRKAAGIENVKRSEKQILTTGRIAQLLLGLPSTRRKVACDAVAEVLIGQFIPSLEHAQTLRETAETQSQLIETMATMVVYRAEKGQWPAALSDLVPAILPAVPADPWSASNAPLHYTRTAEGFLLYSIGYNETDDGGKDGTDIDDIENAYDDIRIVVPEPKTAEKE